MPATGFIPETARWMVGARVFHNEGGQRHGITNFGCNVDATTRQPLKETQKTAVEDQAHQVCTDNKPVDRNAASRSSDPYPSLLLAGGSAEEEEHSDIMGWSNYQRQPVRR